MEEVEEDKEWLATLLQEMRKLGWENPIELSVREFEHTGRGLCSKTTRLLVGDNIISLPFECLISLVSIENDAVFLNMLDRKLLDDPTCTESMQSWLALYLLYQKRQPENAYMRAYIDSLPTTFSVPYFSEKHEMCWFPADVQNYLDQQICSIPPNGINHVLKERHCDLFSREEYLWAWFIVNTRSVYVDISAIADECLPAERVLQRHVRDKPNMVLAPFMDLFNHSPKISNKATIVKHGSGKFALSLQMTGNEQEPPVVSPYEQIFISYGELNDLKLLMEYGMVLPENAHNFYTISELQLRNFVQKDYKIKPANFNAKYAYLKQRGLTANLFLYENDENVLSHNLQVLFTLLFLERTTDERAYNRIVFGDSSMLLDCRQIVNNLLSFLILEYRCCLCNMEALEKKSSFVTEAHKSVKNYVQKTINFFQTLQN